MFKKQPISSTVVPGFWQLIISTHPFIQLGLDNGSSSVAGESKLIDAAAEQTIPETIPEVIPEEIPETL